MRTVLKYWGFLSLTLVLFNCGSNKPNGVGSSIPMEKAYVLLRSEGAENDLTDLKNILNSDFVTNNIASNIVSYPLGKAWNNNQIFSTAYNDKYDYIILIDQVAKFTIDNKTQVGGKYQIRSYHVKSPNADWIDLGQKTCNITVKPSIKKFTQQIVSNIVPNYKSSTRSISEDEEYAEDLSSTNSGYQTFKSSKEIDNEIDELKNQLKLEKDKTKEILADKERLSKQYEEALANEKIKTEMALNSLKFAKQEKANQLIAQEELSRKIQRQKEIAEEITAKREEIRKKELEEALKNPIVVIEENKEPTREDRLKERQQAKKRIAEERALIRKKQEENAFKRQEEKRRLFEEKSNEQKRLTQAKKQKELLELKQQQEEERLATLNETKRIEAEKEEEKRLAEILKEEQELAESKKIKKQKAKEEEKRLAQAKRDQEILELKQQKEKERLATLNETKRIEEEKEEEKKLAIILKEEQELAESKKIKKQKAKEEEKRLTQAKRDQEILELKQQKEKERLATLNETKRIKAVREEEKRLAKVLKDEQELARQKISREEKRLAEAKNEKEEFELKRQLKEEKRLAQIQEKEKSIQKQIDKNTPKNKKLTSKEKPSNNGKTTTLVILRTNKDGVDHLKKLQDNIEFDLLFAKAIATTKIYDSTNELDLTKIYDSYKSKYNAVIIVNQLDYKGDGYSNYQISIYNYDIDSSWNELDIQAYNISDRASIKEFSKTIVNSL